MNDTGTKPSHVKIGAPYLTFESDTPSIPASALLAQDLEDRKVVRKDSNKSMRLTKYAVISELGVGVLIVLYMLGMYCYAGELQDMLLKCLTTIVIAILLHSGALLRSANTNTWAKFRET